jgi:hypothetical protein
MVFSFLRARLRGRFWVLRDGSQKIALKSSRTVPGESENRPGGSSFLRQKSPAAGRPRGLTFILKMNLSAFYAQPKNALPSVKVKPVKAKKKLFVLR